MTKKSFLVLILIFGIIVVVLTFPVLVKKVCKITNTKPPMAEVEKKETLKKDTISVNEELSKKIINEDTIKYPLVTADGIEFMYKSDTAQRVFVAGTFNDWDGRYGVMTKSHDGFWIATLKIKPGRYTYKFKVDGKWLVDPQNLISADGDGGNRVSVLIVRSWDGGIVR